MAQAQQENHPVVTEVIIRLPLQLPSLQSLEKDRMELLTVGIGKSNPCLHKSKNKKQMEKTLHVKTFIYSNGTPQQQLVDFVQQNGIRREDILTINSSGGLEIIYYYA